MKILNDEIHIWLAYDEDIQDENLLRSYAKILSAEETSRLKRFNFEKQRHQYLISRALLRNVLSSYVKNISPEQWIFVRNEHGKPFIANQNLPLSLHFNLSHTRGMIVLAVTASNHLGVDVENSLRSVKMLEIAYRYFSPHEYEALQTKPIKDQACFFYDLWTLKEAYVKARGMGLAHSLNKAIFSIENNHISAYLDAELGNNIKDWNFWLIRPDNAYVIAIAKQNLMPAVKFSLNIREIIPSLSMRDISSHTKVITTSVF